MILLKITQLIFHIQNGDPVANVCIIKHINENRDFILFLGNKTKRYFIMTTQCRQSYHKKLLNFDSIENYATYISHTKWGPDGKCVYHKAYH